MKKSRALKILEAYNDLNKAISMDEPHLRIRLPWGVSSNEEGREFIKAAKDFVRAYKKYYELEKMEMELVLD